MKSKKAAISEVEIQQALSNFKARGGLIKKLPDEIVPSHNLVGSKWAMFETIQDSSAGSVPEVN